jgi:hypothetical protein
MNTDDRLKLEKAKRNAHLVALVASIVFGVYFSFDPTGDPDRPWYAIPACIGMLYLILLIFTWASFVTPVKARTRG